jgi:multidrug efflux pump subunit AcrB
MRTNYANLFYTNPRLTALLVLFIVVMGGLAYLTLARQEDPTMTERWARVTTFLPGATAARIESQVSEPIETKLREIAEIDEISSTSKGGLSVVNIELYDSVGPGEVDTIWSEIRDTLSEIEPELPFGATTPELEQNKPLASTLVLALRWREGQAELGILSRLGESLRLQLANLPGTEEAELFGEVEEEVLVAIDPYRLAAAQLTPEAVAERIGLADTKLASGRLRAANTDILIEVDADLDTVERIGRIPLLSAADGSVLRVSDVATVERTFVDPPATMALHGLERVVFVNAKMQPGLQIEAWVERANAVVADFAGTLPSGVDLDTVYDQNVYTGARMGDLGTNLLFALMIVLLALIWFMGARSALTVGIALPLSGAMVLAGMQFMGIPLHQMSVTGLIISLGLLIDNAIVVVEGYKLKRARGSSIEDAIASAIRHLVVPLGASTATTVFAFMPIATAPGGVGDFTGTIGVSVALAVASSFAIAMTVVPTVAGLLERRWPSSEGHRWWQSGFAHAGLTRRYRNTVMAVLRRPVVGIGVACVLPFLGFALAPTLTQQFFPPVDRNQFQVQLSLPAPTSISATRAAVERADGILREFPEVTDTYWSIGEGAPRVFYNVTTLNDGVASYASAWVDTVSPEATLAVLPALQAELSAALSNAEVLAIPFEQGPPTAAPIEVRIVGPDLDVLRTLAEDVRRVLASVDHVTYTRATLSTMEPKLVFVPNENAAARAGFATGEISSRLNASLLGVRAGTVQEGNTELDVRVRLVDDRRDNVTDLATLPLAGRDRTTVPLDEIGRWELVPTPTAIDRRQGERLSTVQGFVVPFTLPAGVLGEFRQRLATEGTGLPPGYRLEFGGEAEQSSESIGNLASTFVFFALAMGGIVVLSLNSFRQAALIGAVGFLSFGLALFGVRLFGYHLGYMAFIGTLGMVGLAINGSIIVLSALRASPEAVSGDIEATADVVVDATRHIVSTTATTIGGFIPLIVAGGTFWPPLATAIAGGVGGSAIIALYMVPAVFVLMHRRTAASEPRHSEQPMARDYWARPAAAPDQIAAG